MSEENGRPEGAPRPVAILDEESGERAEAALAVRVNEPLVLNIAGALPAAAAQFKAILAFVKESMDSGDDFGKVEGIAKPFLFKSGAEKLAALFGFAPVYVTLDKIEDWGERRPLGFFHYRYRCDLKSKRSGVVMGSGIGSCNSMEDRYRYVGGKRKCPACNAETIIKGKAEYGGGWVCWSKTSAACGAKYPIDAKEITGQSVERVERETFSLVNTIDKMAQKRALVAAVLIATGTSAIFTQDEETTEGEKGAETAKSAVVVANGSSKSPEAGALAKAGADAPFWRESTPLEFERLFRHPEDKHGKAKNRKTAELPPGCRWEKRKHPDQEGKDSWLGMVDAGVHGGDSRETPAPVPAPKPATVTVEPVVVVPTASAPMNLDLEIERALAACGFGVAAIQIAARQMGQTDGDWKKMSNAQKEGWLGKLIDHAAASAGR